MKSILVLFLLFFSINAGFAAPSNDGSQAASFDEDSFFIDPYGYRQWESFGNSWDPFEEMLRMRKEMNEMFNYFDSRFKQTFVNVDLGTPKIEMSETKEDYNYAIDLRNFAEDSVKIEIKDGYFILSAERNASTQSKRDDGFSSQSVAYGTFSRVFPLPKDSDPDKLTSNNEAGILKIKVPKKL